jgi:hypothetical protein
MLKKLSQAVDEQAHQPAKTKPFINLRVIGGWFVQHLAAIALLVAICSAVITGAVYFGYKVGESKAEAYSLFDELDLRTTAKFARQATIDLGFASARFADVLKSTGSSSELLEANAKLEASNKDLLKKNAELALEADHAKRDRDRLQAVIDRARRADQTKK